MNTRNIKALSIAALTVLLSCNMSAKDAKLNPREFQAKIKELKNETIIDVRTPEEYSEGHIQDAINIDWNSAEFSDEVAKLDKSKPVMVYCYVGGRSGSAAQALRGMGFQVYDLQGGISAWRKEGLPEDGKVSTHADAMTLDQYHKLLQTEKLVLVDFNAPWCGPCKKMAPFLDEIAKEQAKTLDFVPINADNNEQLSVELGVEALPTLLLYKNGNVVWRHVGYINKEDLSEKISSFM